MTCAGGGSRAGRVLGDDGDMYLEAFGVEMLRKLADNTLGATPAKMGDC